MKKAFLALALGLALNASGQSHSKFLSAGRSVAFVKGSPKSASLEYGYWGIESKFSLSATAAYDFSAKDFYLGAKPYYTLFDNGHISAMAYASPQWNLSNNWQFLAEEGAGLNLSLSRKLMTGLYFYSQQTKGSNLMFGYWASLVYLLRK